MSQKMTGQRLMHGIPRILGPIARERSPHMIMKNTLIMKVILKNLRAKGTVPILSSSIVAEGM